MREDVSLSPVAHPRTNPPHSRNNLLGCFDLGFETVGVWDAILFLSSISGADGWTERRLLFGESAEGSAHLCIKVRESRQTA